MPTAAELEEKLKHELKATEVVSRAASTITQPCVISLHRYRSPSQQLQRPF